MHPRLLPTFLIAGLALAGASLAQPADTAPAAPKDGKPPQSAPAATPSAQEIVARYVKAIGGEEAIRKHTSRTDKGSMTMGAMSGSMTVYSAAPNKRVGIFNTEQMGVINQGYNGDKGWEMGPQGKRLLEGEALADRARTSDFYQPLNLLTNHEVRVVGAETFGGKPAFRLGLKHNDNKAGPEQFMIFDAASGLLIGRVTERQTAAGPVKLETTIADYKEFGGVLTPTRITTLVMGQEQVMTIESVEFDTVPESAFQVPKELTQGDK